jgi:serine phosphatase RsbU (regulator of sigma subunit)
MVLAAEEGHWWMRVTGGETLFSNQDPVKGLLRLEPDKEPQFYDAQGLLLSNGVFHVSTDPKGGQWLYSVKGLTYLKGNRGKHLTIADGLSGNLPRDLVWDESGGMWIATNGGLNRYRGGLLTEISIEDGLLDSDVLDIELGRNNQLWIRTRHGLQRYRENIEGPPVVLLAVNQGDQSLPLDGKPKLAYDQNSLSFQLTALELRREAAQVQFAYRLEGNRGGWSGTTREKEIHLPGLQPDQYRIRLQALNRDLFPSREPVIYEFTIQAPFWARPAFQITAVATLLLLGYLAYRFRLRGRLEKERVLNELKTAQAVQLSLMPMEHPEVPGFEIKGLCRPAREVGGDFFDYFWLDRSKSCYGMTIMDVSGKSMQAAIISVMTSGLVYGEIGRGETPGEIFSKINYPIYKKTTRRVFVTGLILSLDLTSKRLTWANAGHMDPIIIRDGQLLPLPAWERKDLPLGGIRNWQYGEHQINVEPGDLIFFYTDGLNEATNVDRELYGDPRLIDYLKANYQLAADALVQGLLAEIDRFAGTQEQHDDITMVAVKVNP